MEDNESTLYEYNQICQRLIVQKKTKKGQKKWLEKRLKEGLLETRPRE